MEELTFDSILSEDQIGNLFSDNEEEPPKDDSTEEKKEKDKDEEITTTEAGINDLFGQSESVGSEEETKEKKDTSSDKSDSSSDFYSSIAKALVEDGVLQDLDVDEIKSADDFADAIQTYISNQLDERQKRIDEALNAGIEPSVVQQYERYINTLDSIKEDILSAEDEQGENLRKNLIYQDCINKGYSKERALKYVEKSISSGSDIEDAKDALEDNRKFYKEQYRKILDEAKEEEKKEQKKIKEQAEKLRNSILNEDKAFGEIKLDKATRQKVYDSIAKPVYTDEEGMKLTAIQKYERENRTDFIKNVGLLFVLTDGFKNIDRLVNDKVKKETKKSLKNLEQTLNSSGNGFRGGNLSFANNSGDTDPESIFKGWRVKL